MSPEQARGEPADARSDIFALGAVVYEMLSGRPAFRRASAAETLAAVLNHEPSELGTSDDLPMPGGLVHIVRRCLEKSPDERFQSASDLAFALSNLSGSSPGASGQSAAPRRRKRRIVAGVLAFLMARLPVAGYLFGKWQWKRPVTSFHRLTFRRGTNWGARFAPDGQTIVYAAVWDGGPMRLFSTRVDSPESRTMDVAEGDVLGISSAGELALCLRRSVRSFPGYSAGTLARMPLAGGAPREILENVLAADWSADGTEIAATRSVNGHSVLEFPIGRVLVETDRVLLSPRVLPKGDVVAFVESDERGDEYRAVSIVDRSGTRRVLTTGWRWMNSLAWSPHGEEVWFAASQAGPNCSLWAVTRSGRIRLLARFPSFALLQDVSSDGRVLIAFGDARWGITGLPRGENRQRDLSWFDLSVANAISIDGRVIVGTESGEGTKRKRAIFLRRTDGASPPVRLGDGDALALSPDSRWVLSRPQDRSGELVLLPTGPGGARTFPGKGIEYEAPAYWAAGGARILVTGRQGSRPWRSLLLDLEGRATAITPEGVVATAISPSGDRVAARDSSGKILIYRWGGGDPQVAPGPPEPGDVGPWSSDGRSIFTTVTDGLAVRVFRRDLVTGRREAITEFLPADPAGMVFVYPVVSADGRSCAYNFAQSLSSLYLIEGLR